MIAYLQVTPTQISFLGFQLLEYLISATREKSASLEKISQATPNINPIQILRFPEVRKLTGLSRTTVWRMEKKGGFPKRVQITSTLVGWHRADIEEWVANRSKI